MCCFMPSSFVNVSASYAIVSLKYAISITACIEMSLSNWKEASYALIGTQMVLKGIEGRGAGATISSFGGP